MVTEEPTMTDPRVIPETDDIPEDDSAEPEDIDADHDE